MILLSNKSIQRSANSRPLIVSVVRHAQIGAKRPGEASALLAALDLPPARALVFVCAVAAPLAFRAINVQRPARVPETVLCPCRRRSPF